LLVVCRKVGEKIVIPLDVETLARLHDRIEAGEDVTLEITPVRVTGEKGVRIGVEAPREVPGYRLELWERIKREGLHDAEDV